jgi:transcriptional regulator with XRE-family HTH domain
MKQLKDWLYENEWSRINFAMEVGVTPTTIQNIIYGRNGPSKKTAKRILEVTKGKVDLSSFVKKKGKQKKSS